MITTDTELSPIRLRDSQGGEFLAVRGVTAEVDVFGPFCRTRIEITFTNDLDRTLEGDLVFPLPPSAALRELNVKVGERDIHGKIRPRQRAQAEYRRAIEAGQTAALGETEGEDMARLRIAPIEKSEDVVVRLVLAHTLLPTDSGHRLLLPLTYMPRYVEDEAALKPTERAAVDRPRPLTLAARANVTIRLRHGAIAPGLRCTSHATQTQTEGTTTVTLSDAPLDRDLHLEIDDRPAGGEPILWLVHDPSEGPDELGPTTAVAIVPPAFADEGPTVPRTVTFLVDRSGSMSGGPMQSAIRAVRGALRALTSADRFNIVAFDDRLDVLATRPVAFDDANLAAADEFIAGIDARGGTNASMAIAAALAPTLAQAQTVALREAAPPAPGHRLSIVVFMTDGDVAGAEQVLRTAKDKLVDTRVFVLGIGYSVNHAMLAELASAGGGTYFPVATDEDLEQTLARLKNAINSPLWTSVGAVLDHEGERRPPKRLTPPPPLDLFAGQPLLLAFRGPVQPGERLILTGQRPGGEDRRMITQLSTASSDEQSAEAARVTWALLENRRLTYRFDPSDDATLEGLGTAFGITNRMVALVGVDAEQREVSIEGSVPVSLPMPANVQTPAGLHMNMTLAGAMPHMPSPAPMAPPPPPSAAYTGSYAAIPPMQGQPIMQAPGSGPSGLLGRAKAAIGRAFSGGGGSPPPAKPAMMSQQKRAAPPQVFDGHDAEDESGAEDLEQTVQIELMPPSFTNDEAGLRKLMLLQNASGLFDGELSVTLAAVAALVAHGHNHREGLFRAELRRTMQTLKARVGSASGDDCVFAALALALLTIPAGDSAPTELPAAIAETLAGLSLRDLGGAEAAIKAALGQAPASLDSHPIARSVLQSFQLR